jgi:hypothetical protein
MRRTGSEVIGEPSRDALERAFSLSITLVKFRAEALDFKREDAGPLLPGFLIAFLLSSFSSSKLHEPLRQHEYRGHDVCERLARRNSWR